MIAAARITKDPARYGFGDVQPEKPLTYDEVVTDAGVRLVEGAGREDAPRIVAELVAAGERVYRVEVRHSSLEEVYLEAVGGETG